MVKGDFLSRCPTGHTGWTDFCEAPRKGASPLCRPCDLMSLSTFDQGLAKTIPGGCLAAIEGPLLTEQLQKPTEWPGSVCLDPPHSLPS